MSAWRERVEIAGGRAVLYLGDNREIWPALGVRPDAIVTDPPYGIGRDGQNESSGIHGGRRPYEWKGWDASRPLDEDLRRSPLLADVAIVWGGNYFADCLPPTSKWLVWDKGQRINQSDGELAWTSMVGALRIFEKNRVALLTDGAEHPTQKPVALMAWCLDQAKVDPGALVADPFMGSGTTGVACMRRGCRFIGIEIDEGYFRTACRRIGEAARQPDLLIPETAA